MHYEIVSCGDNLHVISKPFSKIKKEKYNQFEQFWLTIS